jgi:hypothetical protein
MEHDILIEDFSNGPDERALLKPRTRAGRVWMLRNGRNIVGLSIVTAAEAEKVKGAAGIRVRDDRPPLLAEQDLDDTVAMSVPGNTDEAESEW